MLAAFLVVETETNKVSMGGENGMAQGSMSFSSSAGGSSPLTFQKGSSSPAANTFGTVRAAAVASGKVCLSEREEVASVRSRSSSVQLAHPERLGEPGPEPVSPLQDEPSTNWGNGRVPPSFLAGTSASQKPTESTEDDVNTLCLRLACEGVQGRSFDERANGDDDVKSWAEVASKLDVDNLLSERAPPSNYDDDNVSVLSSMSCDNQSMDSQQQPSPRTEYPGDPRFKGNFVAAPLPMLARNGRRSRGKQFQHNNRSHRDQGNSGRDGGREGGREGGRGGSRGVDMGSRSGIPGGNRGNLSKSRAGKSRGGSSGGLTASRGNNWPASPASPTSWWASDDSSGRQYQLPEGRHIARVPSPSTSSDHLDQSSLPGVKRKPPIKALSDVASHREDSGNTPFALSPLLSPELSPSSTPFVGEKSTQLFHRVPKASPSRIHATNYTASLVAANNLSTSPLVRSGASAVSGLKPARPPSPLSPTSPTSASLALSSSASCASLNSSR